MRFNEIHNTDQIFCIGQTVEKRKVYNGKECQLFIGFIKAYNLGQRINAQHTHSVAILPGWTDEKPLRQLASRYETQPGTPLNKKEK
jgi:hypothetical protein